MISFVVKWLKIYEDEIRLFLWTTLLLFLIRSAGILFDNFAETAFLKRFGVEYLPIVYVVNSLSTFFIMGIITGLMSRMTGSKLLFYMLLFCGVSVGGLRLLIPYGFEMLYPVLFVLKAQYEVLLALLFWNLANDLFNTRQSKRLFPLITAGGVVGGIIGSFGTPFITRYILIDNLMWVYLFVNIGAALVLNRMDAFFPSLLQEEKKARKVARRPSMVDEFRKVLPLLKQSTLIKVLVFLTLLPNVVIPIMNYQFNYAVDQTFATEGKMLAFFGYFRGSLNSISFIILLFVGRIYGRWGLPVALMFHPFNYVIAFLGFLFRFDVVSAMYARMSTNILRTTINNPARAVLMGLFPPEHRSAVRPFLRGTVVRIGILVGSGCIILFERISHPRFLSVVGVVFVAGWVGTTLFFKRRYGRILLELISQNMIDLKSLEERDVSELFRDKSIREQLVEAFHGSRGRNALWYARLMRSLGMEDLDDHILSVIREQDHHTRMGLLSLISSKAGEKSLPVLEELADADNPELAAAAIRALNRLPPGLILDLDLKIFEKGRSPEEKAYAIKGLYEQDPRTYRKIIQDWLDSGEAAYKRAGVIAAGESGDRFFVQGLKELLGREQGGPILPLVMEALHQLEAEDIKDLAYPLLSHPDESLRVTALRAIEIAEEKDLRAVIPLLNDTSEEILRLAKEKIENAPYQNTQLLVESLGIPKRQVREGIFEILERMNISDADILHFATAQLERAYRNLVEAEAVRTGRKSPERELLADHLLQKKDFRVETILRVLAAQDRSGRMRLIWRGIFSADTRQKSNAIEALEETTGRSLTRNLIPLLEGQPAAELMEVAKRQFRISSPDKDPAALYISLLSRKDWVTVVLTLSVIAGEGLNGLDRTRVEPFLRSDNPHVRQAARGAVKESEMEKGISLPDKIFHLRGIQIFEGLSVSELAAIGSITEEVHYPAGRIIIREGEPGDTMYLIITGEVSVLKGVEQGKEVELDRIRAGDYFGEMALFENTVRSATIRAEKDTGVLVLHKREFTEIVREYPEIALHICRELSNRLRRSHEKLHRCEVDLTRDK